MCLNGWCLTARKNRGHKLGRVALPRGKGAADRARQEAWLDCPMLAIPAGCDCAGRCNCTTVRPPASSVCRQPGLRLTVTCAHMLPQRANVLRDLRAPLPPEGTGKRYMLSAHHFRAEDLKERTGVHKMRRKSRGWENQNHLCGSGDGPRKKAKRAPIEGLNKDQLEFVLPDQPRDVIEEEALRTRTLPERVVDGRHAAVETATERLVSATTPARRDEAAALAARVQEHADAQVAAAAAAPTVQHAGQRVDANHILEKMLRLEEQNRQLQERNAHLEAMPAMSAERLEMDARLQKGMRAQTGFGSYPTFLAFMDHFHVYYPKGVKVYRGLESVPKDKLEAAVAKNAKERGTVAPGAALPWFDNEGAVAGADDGAASSGDEDAPTGRVGSGICAEEEEEEPTASAAATSE